MSSEVRRFEVTGIIPEAWQQTLYICAIIIMGIYGNLTPLNHYGGTGDVNVLIEAHSYC